MADVANVVEFEEHGAPNPPGRNYLQITILASTYTYSSVASMAYKNSGMVQFVVYGPATLHVLGEAIGERTTALIAVGGAVIVSLCNVYTQGNTTLFIFCLISSFVGVIIFSLAGWDGQLVPGQDLEVSKTFVALCLAIKALPRDNSSDHDISDLRDIHNALFVVSFSFSIMGLWLLASGAPNFNPTRREFYTRVRMRPSTLAASVLCWLGFSLLVVVFILSVIVSPFGEHMSGLRRACQMSICGHS